jgi:hypothetical protein
LVQLLLNQKILLFRKGRVSTSPNLGYADFHALAALSVASKPHTALLSTTKGPQGQHAAGQLKILYAQLQHDIDAYNARKTTINPAFTTPGQSSQPTASLTSEHLQREQVHGSASLEHPLRPFSGPNSPILWQQSASMGGGSALGATAWPAMQLPHTTSEDKLNSSGGVMNSEEIDYLGGFHLPSVGEFDTSLLDSRFEPRETRTDTPTSCSLPTTSIQSVPSKMATLPTPLVRTSTAWMATPPFVKTNQVTFTQIFAHKFLQSKWGLTHPLLSQQQQRFPFAALWHMDLRS